MSQPPAKEDRPEILVLADDLTGALEAGAAFALRGIDVEVAILKVPGTEKRVLVVDTETRHLAETDAGARVEKVAKSASAKLIYKKTDSTLRGNIRAELHALSLIGPVLYVPAYPQLGRTLRNGHLHVHGIPVEQTPFALDPLHPVRIGNIGLLLTGTSNITIFAENSEEAIEDAAREWIESGGIAAGPSSLLHAAAKVLAPECSSVAFPNVRRALVVSGSRHRRSQEQIAAASDFLETWGWKLFCAPFEHQGDPLAFAARFGQDVRSAVESDRFDTIIVFGGDTAFALLKAMHIDMVQPIGEVLPGIPVSFLPDKTILITKAGGFGDPDLLFQLHERLSA